MALLMKPEPFSQEVNRLFNTLFDSGSLESQRWVPAMDLVETEDALILKADLPGLERDDVSIEVKDNVLTVSGQRDSEHSEKTDGYYRVERASGSFSRSLALPDGVDADLVKASFDKGVLEVTIPKPEERKPHRVEIGLDEPAALEGSAEEK